METLSRLVLTFLLNATWQIVFLACVGAVIQRMMRRASASYGHMVWVMVLALSVILPIESAWSTRNSGAFPSLVTATAQPEARGSLLLPASDASLPLQAWRVTEDGKDSPTLFTRGLSLIQRASRPIPFSPFMAWIVMACYAGSLVFHAFRLCLAWCRTKAIGRSAGARELPADMAISASRCRNSLGLAEAPILSSAQIAGPITLGARTPVIILPDILFVKASGAELTSVFAHEMAHILRRDYLMNVLYELISLPVSFHPGIKLIKRGINETRELACDEIAAGRLPSTPDYARSLVALARRISAAPAPSRSGYSLGVFDANILEERIMRILNQKSLIGSRLAKGIFAAGAFLLAASCIFASAFTLSANQENNAPSDDTLKPFVGTWQAKLKGKPYVIVRLNIEDHKLTGQVASIRVHMDDKGNPASTEGEACSITDARVDGKNLTLSSDCPGGITREFEIRLIGDKELKFRVLGVTPLPEEADGLKLMKEPEESGQISNPFLPYLGTWQANFAGHSFMALTLSADGDKLTGIMSPCRITLDENGKLTSAERGSDGGGWHIINGKLDGSKLTLEAKEDSSGEVDKFEMSLKGPSTAGFKPLGGPMAVEPWQMTRGEWEGDHPPAPPAPPPPSPPPPPPRLASLDQDMRSAGAGK